MPVDHILNDPWVEIITTLFFFFWGGGGLICSLIFFFEIGFCHYDDLNS